MMRTRNPLILYRNENEIAKIRDLVVSRYEKNCKEREIERFEYDLTRPENRLKVFVLGIFFNCEFHEKKALDIFREMDKKGYLRLEELDNFENNLKTTIRSLERRTGRSHNILRTQDIIDSVIVAKDLFSQDGDIVKLYKKNDPKKFVEYLYSRLSGIKVKLFWICRELRDLLKIPREFCYVPDRHVVRFLWNMKAISREGNLSLDDCFKLSKWMSLHLDNEYFDLPFMRFHQEKCKNQIGCSCEIGNCRFNQRVSNTRLLQSESS